MYIIAKPEGEASNLDAGLTVHLYVCMCIYMYIYTVQVAIYIYIYNLYISIGFTLQHLASKSYRQLFLVPAVAPHFLNH